MKIHYKVRKIDCGKLVNINSQKINTMMYEIESIIDQLEGQY